MKRGEIWTVSGRGPYAGKPRPAVIIQDDRFDATDSIAVCALTTDPADTPLLRVPVEPSSENGLREPSRLMIEKITTLPRGRMGARIGRLEPEVIGKLDQALLVFLGLAARATRRRRPSRSLA
jgi:mRNA interferase MazF